MPYSEATHRDGSRNDFRGVVGIGVPRFSFNSRPTTALSPQRKQHRDQSSRKLSTAQGCAVRSGDSGEDLAEDDAGADADESDADEECAVELALFARSPGKYVSRSMGASPSAKLRAQRKHNRRANEGHVQKEIVITRSPVLHSNAKSTSGRGTVSPDVNRVGSSNTVARTYTSPQKNSVQRTYAGTRKIREISIASEYSANIISAPGYNGFGRSQLNRLVSPDKSVTDEIPSSDTDVFPESISQKSPSRRVYPNKEVIKSSPPKASSHSGPIAGPSSRNQRPPSQSRTNHSQSKSHFFSSLTNVINEQRHETIRDQSLIENESKSKTKLTPTKLSTPRQSPTAVQKRREGTAVRSAIPCVVIPPDPLPVPRELYKSMDEYDAEEEAEMLTREARRNPKQKQKQKYGNESGNERTRETQVAIERGQAGKKKRSQKIRDVIYVSSGSESKAAGSPKRQQQQPQTASPSTQARDLVEDSDVGTRNDVPIIIDISSSAHDEVEEDIPRPDRSSQNDNASSSISPRLLAKRQRKRRKTGIVVSSTSGSASESNPLRTETAKQSGRRSPLSPDLLKMPMPGPITHAAVKQRRTEEISGKAIGTNVEDLRDAPTICDRSDVFVDPSTHQEDSSATPLSIKAGDNAAQSAPSAEIFVTSKPPSSRSEKPSTQPRSPTLCLTGTLSKLTSLSPSSRSTTLAVPEDSLGTDAGSSESDANLKKPSKFRGDAMDPESTDESDSLQAPEQAISSSESGSSSSDEEDDVCHRCRNRNVYAKMKCTKIKKNEMCRLHFCHRCCVVHFPNIVFDPYTARFTCPSCEGTCDCINCCRKRDEEPVLQPRGRRVGLLGIALLFSPQETRRRERLEMRRAAGKEPNEKRTKTTKRSQAEGSTKAQRKAVVDIGEEAEAWIKGQSTEGKRCVRAFVGAWQDGWGPKPATIREMDAVDLDVHAAYGNGKGKDKAVDPNVRLFVGDEKGLHRPFLRAADVIITPVGSESRSTPKKRPGRKRKQPVTDEISVGPPSSAVPPIKKKRRVGQANPIAIPEFTMNNRDSTSAMSSSVASSAFHATPDDFTRLGLGLDPISLDPDPYGRIRYSGVANDPMLGSINSEEFGMDMYAPDWDSIPTKSIVAPDDDGPLNQRVFVYEGSYDSYAAALEGGGDSFDQYAPTIGTSIADAIYVTSKRNPTGATVLQTSAQDDFAQLVDPALIEESSGTKTSENAIDAGTDADPLQFLTVHGREDMLLAAPMIYGMPSSTGLSLQELERTVRDSLSALDVN